MNIYEWIGSAVATALLLGGYLAPWLYKLTHPTKEKQEAPTTIGEIMDA